MVNQGNYQRDKEKYDFRGSNMLLVAVFAGVMALRYFEVIDWSWFVVWPVGIVAAVVVAALVSTVIHT